MAITKTDVAVAVGLLAFTGLVWNSTRGPAPRDTQAEFAAARTNEQTTQPRRIGLPQLENIGGAVSVTVLNENTGLYDTPAGTRFYFLTKGRTYPVISAEPLLAGHGVAMDTWWFEVNMSGTTGWVSQWAVKANMKETP